LRHRTQTLRSRIILAFTAAGLVLCSVFALATYSIARGYLQQQRHRGVLRQAYIDANFLRDRLTTSGTTIADAVAALNPEGATAVLVERGGRWSSSKLGVGPKAVPFQVQRQAGLGRVAYAPTRVGDAAGLAVGVPVPGVGVIVYEITPLTEMQATLRVLSAVLSAGTLLGAVTALLVGLWARRRILKPLAPITSTAAAIAGGDLDRRLPATDDPDLVTMVGSFNSMVDALQQRIERDTRFTADVSHELRSPLTTLVGSVEMLNARAATLPRRIQEIIDLITAELDRFHRLLESLLDLARADAGADIAPRRVDVVELVAQVLRQSGRRHELLDAEGPAAVMGDRLQLERAVVNLLDNADRHGGGTERAGVRAEDGQVWITVDDGGPGIAPADRDRVFERFATGGGPRRSGSGSGLGLALVHEIARIHHGAVWCTDSPAGGARLVLRMPEAR
jgi:two-component system sensor histidine kinase MtrB